MKRNVNLKTLSWEHHHGLVTALRLKKGIKNKVDVADLAGYILHVWENELIHHFWQEEQIIPPQIKGLSAGEKLLDRMLSDHNTFNLLIKKIKNDSGSLSKIREFAEMLNQHIHFEERELFPFLEKTVAADKLAVIGEFLAEHHVSTTNDWKPKFWENFGNP